MSASHPIVFWLSFLPSALFLGYIIQRYVTALRARPKIAKGEIVYEERFASGASQKNFLTKIGGARNCLRLVVTNDLLWITSWFPFGIFAVVWDLEHVVPFGRVSSVRAERFFGSDSLLLSYADDSGESHSVRIIPRDRERFVGALKLSAEQLAANH